METKNILERFSFKMIKYYNEVKTKEGYILSVDMVRLVFKFKSTADIEEMYKQLQFADLGLHCNLSEDELDTSRPPIIYDYYQSRSMRFGKYKTMFTIYCDQNKKNEGSFCLGIGLQNSKETLTQGFIEFNPNKCHGEVLEWILRFLRAHCKYICVARYDLALDVPVLGSLIQIHKDQRKYELQKPNSDPACDTEYLGTRNKAGRFKKYNKKVEYNQKLSKGELPIDDEVTRLELTLDSLNYEQCKSLFPDAEVKTGEQTDLFDYLTYQEAFEKLSDTDKVIVELLNKSDEKDLYFQRLGRDKRKKLKSFVYDYSYKKIEVDEAAFYKCIENMKEYCHLFNSVIRDKLTA